MHNDTIKRKTSLLQRALVQPNSGNGQFKDLDNRGADHTFEAGIPTADVICYGACLPGSRTCHRQRGFRPGDAAEHLGSIADSVNIGVGGLHVRVGGNRAAEAECQSGIFCQLVLWAHADGKDHHLRIHLAFTGEGNLQPAFGIAFADGFQAVAQCQANALEDQVLMHQGCHLVIDGCHHLVEHLDQGHFHAAIDQILRNFKPDETAAHHNCAGRLLLVHKGFDLVHVGNVAQREHAGQIHSGQRRNDGSGTG